MSSLTRPIVKRLVVVASAPFRTGIVVLLCLGLNLMTLIAQGTPPGQVPSPSQSAPAKTYEPPSLLSGGSFTSLDGRFSVSLPTQPSGFGPLTIQTPFGTARGQAYNWRLKEAAFIVGHAEAPQLVETPEVARQIFASVREQLKKLAAANSGNLGADKLIELDKHPGIEQRVDLFSGYMVQRTYLVSSRLYQTLMIVKTTQKEFEVAAAKVLESFKILSEAEVSAKLADEALKAEPSPLPQQPVATRIGSDASDLGLRGNVKTVLEESQDLSGTWSVQTRKRDSLESFNQQGNLIRRESYDYKGNLSDITVYGYIDAARVSQSKTIRREYNPPSVAGRAPPDAEVKKSDPRYQTRYEFKYDEQKRLVEKSLFNNKLERFSRSVYNYNGNQLEQLFYSQDGSLNQRYISILDPKGNELERTSFDVRDNASSAKYSYTYEFDSHGNWTKRRTSKVIAKDGRSQVEPLYLDFRTITYW